MPKDKWIWLLLVVLVLDIATLACFEIFRTPRTSPPTVASGSSIASQKSSSTLSNTTAPKPPTNVLRHQSGSRTVHAAKNADASLPPPGTPLKQTYDELKARADAGDAQAASRLYSDLQRCSRSDHIQRMLPWITQTMDAGASVNKQPSSDQLKFVSALLDVQQRQLDFVRENQALCDDLDKQELSSVFPAALRAAQLGDEQALDCYVASNMGALRDLIDHPEWLGQYKENAPALIESAVQRGDWEVVSLLHSAYDGTFTGSMLSELVSPDPATSYRYLQLQRVGASGALAKRLDKQIARAEQQLTASQIADAVAWAQDEYSRYFNDSSSNVDYNLSKTCFGTNR